VVTRIAKGKAPASVMIESAGGDNGGNCGMGRHLLEISKSGAPIALVLDQRSTSGRYHIISCNQLRLDEISGDLSP
jgi:hypothetical protein